MYTASTPPGQVICDIYPFRENLQSSYSCLVQYYLFSKLRITFFPKRALFFSFRINLPAFYHKYCFLIGYATRHLFCFSRNSAVFYWKSANLIGPPTVFYLPMVNDRARSSKSGKISWFLAQKRILYLHTNLRYYARPDWSIWSQIHGLLCR